jgi:hypothetical protein
VKTRLLTLFLLLSIALSACMPAATPTAFTAPPLPAQTETAAASSTPLPDPTVTIVPTLAATSTPTDEPAFAGALSIEQRERLAAAAQAYISPTPEEAFAAAIRLGYLGRNANPATMCGPLALAILRDAGLIDSGVPLVSFYYLNPRPGHDERLLHDVFPLERFEKIEHEASIGAFDFSAQPLYPGDFLYLFAGDSGSFEHMLVVSRVDDAGRAFSVTNINTEAGVVVKEVMLYDPAQPGEGQFYEWTNWENRMIGRTGYGGFWVWRLLP